MVEFVGFAQSPQIPEGDEHLVHQLTLATHINTDAATRRIFAADSAHAWLGATSKFALQPGGKIETSERTITVIEVNLPKSATMIADSFGELRIALKKQGAGTLVDIRFSRWALPAETEEFWLVTRDLCAKLETLLEVNVG